MTYAGIKRFAAGKTITGIIVGGIGAIMLICSLPFVVGIALAAAMVYYGWKLMKNGSADNGVSSFDPEPASAAYQSHFDDEWEEFLKKNNINILGGIRYGIKRIRDMFVASVHEGLDKMENPKVMLNQYVRDMESDIAKAKQTIVKQHTIAYQFKKKI